MASPDPFNLQRFLAAQQGVYERAVRELGAGRKQSHWMWFIFPQIQGLGSSPTAREFAIADLDEARAYLSHALLGSRLRHCTSLVLESKLPGVEEIFGYPDHLKFHSCMSLFAKADAAESEFAQALRQYFDSRLDPQTLQRL